jgi:hypothetical protein
MDEGFNTFINLSSVDFNNGEYKAEPIDLHQRAVLTFWFRNYYEFSW